MCSRLHEVLLTFAPTTVPDKNNYRSAASYVTAETLPSYAFVVTFRAFTAAHGDSGRILIGPISGRIEVLAGLRAVLLVG